MICFARLKAHAEYHSSKLIVEKLRLLPSGRTLGLVKDEAAIEHYGALAFEPSPESLRSPETRKIVEQSFVTMELLAKTDAVEGKLTFSEISLET